jgi:hypothetical protein
MGVETDEAPGDATLAPATPARGAAAGQDRLRATLATLALAFVASIAYVDPDNYLRRSLYESLRIGPFRARPAALCAAGLSGINSFYLAVGLIGATEMPHVIYRHAALTNGPHTRQRRPQERAADLGPLARSGKTQQAPSLLLRRERQRLRWRLAHSPFGRRAAVWLRLPRGRPSRSRSGFAQSWSIAATMLSANSSGRDRNG